MSTAATVKRKKPERLLLTVGRGALVFREKPCVRCGSHDFYAGSGGRCASCARKKANEKRLSDIDADKARKADYRKTNRDALNAKDAERYAENRDKRIAEAAEYRKNNQDKIKASRVSYKEKNNEQIKARDAVRHAANREKRNAKIAAWRRANKDVVLTHNRNRRAKEISSGKLSVGLREKLFKLQRGKCACGCAQPLGDDYHLDHRMPLALEGPNTDDNIQLLCKLCNIKKKAKDPIEFMQSKGFLL